MPRANRRRPEAPRPLGGLAGSVTATQSWGGRVWSVRHLAGMAPERTYWCPGCEQEVDGGTPHVVVWPADGASGVGERRHWHTPCWSARERRRPSRG